MGIQLEYPQQMFSIEKRKTIKVSILEILSYLEALKHKWSIHRWLVCQKLIIAYPICLKYSVTDRPNTVFTLSTGTTYLLTIQYTSEELIIGGVFGDNYGIIFYSSP